MAKKVYSRDIDKISSSKFIRPVRMKVGNEVKT